MIWQDAVFLGGSFLTLFVLMATLRDSMANVPLGTALPSALLSVVYGSTFLSLGMTLAGVGSFLIGVMWTLIAYYRSPHPFTDGRAASVVADRDAAPTAPNAD